MNINNYLEFINESFDSAKLSGVFSYIEIKRASFISNLKRICINNDILLSSVTDDLFQYMSYVEFESELSKSDSEVLKRPFVAFGFKLDGTYVDYEMFKSQLPDDLDNYALKHCDFFLVFSLGEVGSEHKGLSDLTKKRAENKEIKKQEDIFDKLGQIDPENVERIAKQLKRIFGGEYPLFYISYKPSSYIRSQNLFSLENLNSGGLLRSIHEFNIKLIKKLSENRKNKNVIMFLEMNNHIKQKLEKFFVESSDDIYSYVQYLQTIREICSDYNIHDYIARLMEYDTFSSARPKKENMESALKIIKKI